MSAFLEADDVMQIARATGPAQTLLLFAGHASQAEVAPLLRDIRCLGVHCLGAVFPQVIAGKQRSDSGFVAASLDSFAPPVLLQGGDLRALSASPGAASSRLECEETTMMVLADADRLDVATLMKRLHRHFGNRYRYLGGGAGTRDGASVPCVFTAEHGLHDSAMALGFFRGPSAVHAGHGWRRAIGPVVATKTSNDTIVELNWRPAYQVYRELIRQSTGTQISDLPFGEVGLKYPLGMIKEDIEDLVRVPLRVTADGGLVVIGGVPAHSVLHILSGVAGDLLAAAARSARQCATSLGGAARHKVIFDCVTRPDFLKEQYATELHSIRDGLLQAGSGEPIGVLARGEVCGMAGGMPEWLNKTTVIGAFA